MSQRRLDWFWTFVGREGEHKEGGSLNSIGSRVNSDLRPVGLFYGLSYWNALFSPHLARGFAFAGRLSLWSLSLLLAGGTILTLGIANKMKLPYFTYMIWIGVIQSTESAPLKLIL